MENSNGSREQDKGDWQLQIEDIDKKKKGTGGRGKHSERRRLKIRLARCNGSNMKYNGSESFSISYTSLNGPSSKRMAGLDEHKTSSSLTRGW